MVNKPLKKIVLADDEEDILEIAKFALEDLSDVTTHYCHSGKEALQEVLNFKPDLVILDFMMPGMDGASTLKAIQQDPSIASTPVVFLTAKVQKDEVEQYIEMGAVDVIPKPFDPLTLGDTIKRIWEQISERQDPVVTLEKK